MGGALGLGGASGVSRGAGCGRCRGPRGPRDGRSPSRLCWWPPPLTDPERPRLFPRVAASQGGGMLGKGVVGGGGGTKAPKPSFVSYVRPEVRGCLAGGASGWSSWGEGCCDPFPREGGGRFLPLCWRGTGPGEARRGALGPPRGQSEDPRCGQAGARAQGPACWRPGEGAQAGKVLRLGHPWVHWRSWGSGHRGKGRVGWFRPLWGLPGACRRGGSTLVIFQ